MMHIVQDPAFMTKMAQIGIVTTGSAGAEAAALIKTQREAAQPIVEKSGYKAMQQPE